MMTQTDLLIQQMLTIYSDKNKSPRVLLNSQKLNVINMNTQEIYEKLKHLWEEFETNHNATSKVSNSRARKALGEIKKLVTPYRTASVESEKKYSTKMILKVKEILSERNLKSENFSTETLYKVGMDNVKKNIEFYFDKTYTCESVIKELFIRGVIDYIERNNNFPYLEK